MRLPAQARPSPNIWHHTATYETENRAADPADRLWTAMLEVSGGWAGRDVLDVGCGTGFHLPRFAQDAATVTGVEPHPDLVALARRRTRRLDPVSVHQGLAQDLPLPDASVDVVHARWAYFFGPSCEPGLAELDRVLRPTGVAMVVDNDPRRSTFGDWFARGYPEVDPDVVEAFWTERGWTRRGVDMGWSFADPADLAAVVRIELDRTTADAVLAEHAAAGGGTDVDYAVNLWWRRA